MTDTTPTPPSPYVMSLKALLTSGVSTTPDGIHWEPSLPYPGPWIVQARAAWEVLHGRATAIRQTTKAEARS